MSFVSKAVGAIGQAIGLVPKPPKMRNIPSTMPAPNADNSSAEMDKAAQLAAAGIMRGRTSTLLTGGAGFNEDPKNTSKILLGQ